MTVTIFITTAFVGFHRWSGAPRSVDYLRSRHRHVFHVRAETRVTHNDRDIEFIQFKDQVDAVIAEAQADGDKLNIETWSCEEWASYLLAKLELSKCEVSEDGENGATVEA